MNGYSYPLGEGSWLKCRLTYHPDYRPNVWSFETGGNPVDWPKIIARGLSGLPRFGNLIPGVMYSVARHSQLLALCLSRLGASSESVKLALIHDAPECLGVGDANTHLKSIVGVGVRKYEAALVDWLCAQMGFTPTAADADLVHVWDKKFGGCEARLLGMDNGEPWSAEVTDPAYIWLSCRIPNASKYDCMDWLNAWESVNVKPSSV